MSRHAAPPKDPRGPTDLSRQPARWWVFAAAAALLVTWHGVRIDALGSAALNADLGIQYYLARITAEGAIPLIDFEHGWNSASWYYNALLYLIAGGNPTLWAWLWGPVMGPLFAGVLLLAVARRLRLEPMMVAVLLAVWVTVTHIPHYKYATAMFWLLVLLPVGAARRDGLALALRLVVPAVVLWFHVELAILLGAGTAMFDLFGDRDTVPRTRLIRGVAVGAGLLAGLAAQLAVYAGLGVPPAEVLRQILFDQTGTYQLHFGYLLGNPDTWRVLVYPASLVVPFVPVVWRRLATSTRFVALLHLSMALIPIRRPGDGHVASAATLLAVVGVLVAYDLARARNVRLAAPRLRIVGGAAAGAVWFSAAIYAGFRIESLLAIVALTLLCLVGVAVAWGGDRPWMSVGALLAAAVLVFGGLGGRIVTQVRSDDGDGQAQAIAEVLREPLDQCLGPEREAWVVPSPLTLYDELEISNPTPYYLFWYHFEGDLDGVMARVDAGQIPVIITPYDWPESMHPIVDQLEDRYEVCTRVEVDETGNLVTVWRDP